MRPLVRMAKENVVKDKFSHVEWTLTSSLNLKSFFVKATCNKSLILLLHFSLLVFLGFLFEKNKCDAAEITDLSRLRRDLLNGYDKNARPIQNHQNATIVKFNIYMKGFDFDEVRSVFTVYAWTVLTWKDEHMKWQPSMYGNVTRIHFSAQELWLPDLSVFNNLDKSEIDHFGNTRILAYSNSLLVWVPPTKFQVGCTSNLRNWPKDVQTCYIVVGSWAHDGAMLNMKLPVNQTSMDTSDMLKNREWDLIGTRIQKRDHFFDCCPGVPFPDIVLTFNIAREGATHRAGIVVPGLAIAMGVLIAFWIQPGATERLILLLVCIINNTMYLSYIYKILPNNGDSVPLVLLFYRDSLMMIAVALVWTVCLRYLAASKRTSPVPLPGFIQSFLGSLPAKILCLDPRPTNSSQSNETRANGELGADGTVDTGKLVGGVNPYQEDWAWLAHLLDRVAFLIYLVMYLFFYLALL